MTLTATFPPSLDALREAAQGLEGVAVRTPLVPLPEPAAGPGRAVYLKAEYAQPIGAFKIRGAYTAIRRLDPEVRRRGVVAYSSGNHAQGVAWAARAFGVRGVIVMPENTPAVKVDGVRRYGGEVVFAGARRSPEQAARAEAIARDEGLTLIPPFDHPDVICGQGTCGLEILDQCPDVRTILVPVSGGGLLGGIAAAVLASGHPAEIVAVEPAGAAKLSAALAAGEPVDIGQGDSIADGLLTPRVGRLTWPIIRLAVSRVLTVTDGEIAAAVRWLHQYARGPDGIPIRVEPSGAVTTAALLAGRAELRGPVVAVASGGNVDPMVFDRLVG
ncbi:MAG: threonine ammonia-lyase [Gemmatimonadota bacterium]